MPALETPKCMKPESLVNYLTSYLPWRKKSFSKFESTKENHFPLPLAAQKEQILFLFSFQKKISARERCQVKSLETNALPYLQVWQW